MRGRRELAKISLCLKIKVCTFDKFASNGNIFAPNGNMEQSYDGKYQVDFIVIRSNFTNNSPQKTKSQQKTRIMLHREAQQKTPDSPWAYLDHAKVRFQSMSSMVSPYCNTCAWKICQFAS